MAEHDLPTLGYKGARIHKVDWNNPAIVARLGRDRDVDVARDLSVSRERVRAVRAALGIPCPRWGTRP